MAIHLIRPPAPVLFKATCRIVDPNYRIIKTQFELDPDCEDYGEYVVMNLMRERGELQDGVRYQFSIAPLLRR